MTTGVRHSRGAMVAYWGLVGTALVLSGCLDSGPVLGADGDELCSLDQDLLWTSLLPDQIPALTLPLMVRADDPTAAYLLDSDRVLGVVMDGEARAYPHNILWWHEIVNDSIGDTWISVTFCPLTGSGLAFDPVLGERRLDLGVSGLLFANNLVMYDRLLDGVYGPQLSASGKCSGFRDTALRTLPVQEMSWGRWRALNPETKVVSRTTGFARNYQRYPYGSYDELTSNELLFPMGVDRSRQIKERTLAIRIGEDGGRGYPFGELAEMGSVVALNETVNGVPTAIFYESRDGQTALAYDARVGPRTLTFDADPAGHFVDRETGSRWEIDGTATDGELEGIRLGVRGDSYSLFWFAWRHFQPNGHTFSNGL